MQKSIESERLIYRPFEMTDSKIIYHYMQNKEIIDNTLSIPYPYLENMAKEWIATHAEKLKNGEYQFAVILKETKLLIGAIEIIVEEFKRGILGYWLAQPYWGNGYGTEMAGRIIQFGFEDLKLNKIYAEYFDFNSRSGKVMEKNGMQLEGRLREHKIKNGKFVDTVIRGILASEWKNRGKTSL